MMEERDLYGPGQTRAIRDILQSLFVCELVRPSKTLWLFFAWTTDIEIVDNSARQFATLSPDWPSTWIRLSSVIDRLASRGGTINILLREAKHNESFVVKLEQLRGRHGKAIRYCVRPDFHEKGMLGDDYLLDGSMNLTVRGVQVNDEHVALRCAKAVVAQRRIELQSKWEQHLR